MDNTLKFKLKSIGSNTNIFAFLFFAVFGFLTIIDAQARILITDPAYYLFNIINDGDFFISGPRYTTVINQFLVLGAVKLHVPLKWLVPLYSFSFALVRLCYYLLAVKVFKNKTAGFAIIAITVIGVSESYFRPTSESTIALLNSVLLFSFLFYSDNRNWGKWKTTIQLIGTISFVVFGYYSHPIALFSLFFVIGYFSLYNKKFTTFYPYLAVITVLLVFMGKVLFGANSEHHSSLYGNLFSSPIVILKELTTYYPYKYFDGHFKQLYRILVVLLISSVIVLFSKRDKRLTALFVAAYSLVYFVAACTSFQKGDSNMQMEKIFIPVVLFSALAFSDGVRNVIKQKDLVINITIIVITVLGLHQISNARELYQGRIDYLKEIVAEAQKEDHRKLIIQRDQIAKKMVFSWGMGIESLMLSSLNPDMPTLTVFCQQGKEIDDEKKSADNFIAAHFRASYAQKRLNEYYFQLPEEEYKEWPIDLK